MMVPGSPLGGVCLARGSLLNRRGRPQHCSVNSVRCLAPSGQLGWGLGGTGSRFSMLSLGQVHTRAFQSNGWVKSQASISQAP